MKSQPPQGLFHWHVSQEEPLLLWASWAPEAANHTSPLQHGLTAHRPTAFETTSVPFLEESCLGLRTLRRSSSFCCSACMRAGLALYESEARAERPLQFFGRVFNPETLVLSGIKAGQICFIVREKY